MFIGREKELIDLYFEYDRVHIEEGRNEKDYNIISNNFYILFVGANCICRFDIGRAQDAFRCFCCVFVDCASFCGFFDRS